MESARSTWTDERLDDLSRRVESGFRQVSEDLRLLSARTDAQNAELSRRIDAQGAGLSRRIDVQGAELQALIIAQGQQLAGLQRLMIQYGATLMVMILVTLLSVLLTRG